MKKIITVFMVFVVVSQLILPVLAADNHVVFETPGLDKIVRDVLNIKTNRKLKESDMLKITDLYLEDNIVLENLNDIAYFKNLESLVLDLQHSLEDLSGIENCTKLKTLGIYFCPISDISILSEINTLEEVQLIETKVENINVILRQKKLKILAILGENSIDISALKNNRTLEAFSFSGPRIENIDVLAKIKSLKILSLSFVKNLNADDLKFLTQLKLKEIALVEMRLDNRIVNILKNIHTLEYLDISYNNITRLTPLYNLKNIKEIENRKAFYPTAEEEITPYITIMENNKILITDVDINSEYLDKFWSVFIGLPPELLSGIITIKITNDYDISYYDPEEEMLVLNNFDSQNESVIYNENDDIIFTEFDINLARLILESFLINNEPADILTYSYILEMIEYYEELDFIYEGFDFLLNYIN